MANEIVDGITALDGKPRMVNGAKLREYRKFQGASRLALYQPYLDELCAPYAIEARGGHWYVLSICPRGEKIIDFLDSERQKEFDRFMANSGVRHY
jgi:hypothetical protein